MRVHPLGVLLAVVLLGAVTGCQSAGNSGQAGSGPASPSAGSTVSARPTPTPGGDLPAAATPPARPMNDLEQAVAARLSRQVAHQGLDLSYVACPPWHGKAPRQLTCRGYIDHVTAPVHVRLSKLVGGAVSFQARLVRGLVATAKLEAKLREDGFTDVNCGSAPAYPSTVGSHIVCAVTKDGQQRYVAATVTSRSGGVMIRSY